MNDCDRQKWSQHYDKLQWAVITITSAGIGTLIAASFSDANYSGPQNSDSVISYTWDTKRGGPSGANAQEVSAFI